MGNRYCFGVGGGGEGGWGGGSMKGLFFPLMHSGTLLLMKEILHRQATKLRGIEGLKAVQDFLHQALDRKP